MGAGRGVPKGDEVLTPLATLRRSRGSLNDPGRPSRSAPLRSAADQAGHHRVPASPLGTVASCVSMATGR